MAHFKAIDTLISYIGGPYFSPDYTGIMIKMVAAPPPKRDLLSLRSLLTRPHLFPNVSSTPSGGGFSNPELCRILDALKQKSLHEFRSAVTGIKTTVDTINVSGALNSWTSEPSHRKKAKRALSLANTLNTRFFPVDQGQDSNNPQPPSPQVPDSWHTALDDIIQKLRQLSDEGEPKYPDAVPQTLVRDVQQSLISLQASSNFLMIVVNPGGLYFKGELHCEATLVTSLFLRETQNLDNAAGPAQVTCIIIIVPALLRPD